MNVLILTVAFLFMFVGGIFVGRELTYLADKRKRKAKVRAEPYDEILDLDLIASYDPETGLYKGYDGVPDIDVEHALMNTDVPPVAGGYIDDESKHWPKSGQ